MVGLALRLLLAFTLFFNSVAVPWAMAAPTTKAGADAAQLHDGTVKPASHGGCHAKTSPDAPAPQPKPCCQGGACHCGCVLPPVMSLAIVILDADGVVSAPARPPQPIARATAVGAPFRPPAAA